MELHPHHEAAVQGLPTAPSSLERNAVNLGLAGFLVALGGAAYLAYRGVRLDAGPASRDSAAVDAYAAAGSLFATAVLVLVTAVYVAITGRMAEGTAAAVRVGQAQAATAKAAVDTAQRQLAISIDLEVARQAQHVGAYIMAGPEYEHGRRAVTLFVVNASVLPIRGVNAFLISRLTGELVQAFGEVPVILGRVDSKGVSYSAEVAVGVHDFNAGIRLVVEFDDDAGRRWRKYESLDTPLIRAENRPRGWENTCDGV